ncbi:hypothetical protein LIER_36028 [Lithospermum erythrorhizon]|uniref:Reverse transcriptase domain-containing protein n=1 Tax=Lithospermum erythrorhizon TaxID=34254 RepID=A0AAV3NZM3_LITER
MSEIRPISLCNMVANIFGKVLPNRLRPVLMLIISETQSAFLPCRIISDNILIAHEVPHYMNHSKNVRNNSMAIKLDMIPYNFLINGAPRGYLRPAWGIRQGDLLLPYLFLLCVDTLTCMLRAAEERGALSGIRISRESPSISHILFADDTMIFSKAGVTEGEEVTRILREYELASGQMININKCSVSFSPHTSTQLRGEILSSSGMREVRDQGKYLGLPSQIGHSKKEVFSLMANFFSANSEGEKGVHRKAWDSLCKDKNEGGLGFKDLECMNLALLAKQGWRIVTNEASLLFKLVKGRYFKRSSFLHAKLGANPAFGWRSC